MQCPKCKHRKTKGTSCKYCARIATLKYQNSLQGKALHRFRAIEQRCKRTGKELGFDREWFLVWALSSRAYRALHAAWVASEYNTWLTPSVDRIDDTLGYVEGNIQWMTWKENYCKWTTSQGCSPFVPITDYVEAPEEEILDYI